MRPTPWVGRPFRTCSNPWIKGHGTGTVHYFCRCCRQIRWTMFEWNAPMECPKRMFQSPVWLKYSIVRLYLFSKPTAASVVECHPSAQIQPWVNAVMSAACGLPGSWECEMSAPAPAKEEAKNGCLAHCPFVGNTRVFIEPVPLLLGIAAVLH